MVWENSSTINLAIYDLGLSVHIVLGSVIWFQKVFVLADNLLGKNQISSSVISESYNYLELSLECFFFTVNMNSDNQVDIMGEIIH